MWLRSLHSCWGCCRFLNLKILQIRRRRGLGREDAPEALVVGWLNSPGRRIRMGQGQDQFVASNWRHCVRRLEPEVRTSLTNLAVASVRLSMQFPVDFRRVKSGEKKFLPCASVTHRTNSHQQSSLDIPTGHQKSPAGDLPLGSHHRPNTCHSNTHLSLA
jgi:hypothetical protein